MDKATFDISNEDGSGRNIDGVKEAINLILENTEKISDQWTQKQLF